MRQVKELRIYVRNPSDSKQTTGARSRDRLSRRYACSFIVSKPFIQKRHPPCAGCFKRK